MKKIIILLFAFISLSMYAQGNRELYLHLDYTLVPQNMLEGTGYTVGYRMKADQVISYKVELGVHNAFRERKVDFTLGNIHYLDMYYNLAQFNLAFIPTWKFQPFSKWNFNLGAGVTGAYQSRISTGTHYEFTGTNSGEDVINVFAKFGVFPGLVGAWEANYLLSPQWNIKLSAQYQMYYQAESLLISGIGIGYSF